MTVEELASADEQLINRVIGGKFTIRECIGVGASGAVYKADQLSLGRTVAVKILRNELASDPRLVRRFHDEALAASRLNHPNTVSVIDYGQTDDGLLYIVMEYLRGRTLTEMLGIPELTDALIAEIIGQVLSGLEEAHESGVVHADLKADNIIVEHRRRDWYLAKVVDFGISRLIGEPDDGSERSICGTPEYMAPEIIRGAEPTFASDIYAVGILLYELMIGVTPFVADGAMETLSRHLREPALPPSQLASRPLEPILEAAALKAIAKNPSDRFLSAAQFREEISTRTRSLPTLDQEAICSACGVQSSSSFKFCPDCGQPRMEFAETREIEPAQLELESQGDRRTITRRFSHLVDTDASVGGLFPLPLIGREPQRKQIEHFLNESGSPHMMQVVGPRGIGRARVVREACTTIEPSITYVTNADPTGLATSFHPIRSLVAHILELPSRVTSEALRLAVGKLSLLERDVPGLCELFGIDSRLRELDANIRRRELVVATTRVLFAVGRERPIILILNNVDRYDHPSQDVLGHLVEADPESLVRIIITNGRDFASRWPDTVWRTNLAPLDSDAVDEIAEHLAGFDFELPTADQLEQCCGVPAQIHHLCRFVAEGGAADSAPTSLADLIAARLDSMPRISRLVCQALSVFGREVEPAVLRAVLGDQLGTEQFSESLTLLAARGFVHNEFSNLVFNDSLARDVVYESIPADVRRELHASAAKELAKLTSSPAILGHHFELGGDLDTGGRLLSEAGDIAIGQLDDSGACVFYNRALASARQMLLAEDTAPNIHLFVTTSIKLAETLRAGGQLGLASGLLAEADDHCRGIPTLRALLFRARAHLRSSEGLIDKAIEAVRDAIGFAITTGSREFLCELYLDLATLYARGGNSANAVTELFEGIDLVTAGDGAQAVDGPLILWRMLLRLSQLKASLGEQQEAAVLAEHALRHAKRVQSAIGSARCLSVLAIQLEGLGLQARANKLRGQAVMQLRELGDRRGTAELLLVGARVSQKMNRIQASTLHEARVLAKEVGWDEGTRRATVVDPD